MCATHTAVCSYAFHKRGSNNNPVWGILGGILFLSRHAWFLPFVFNPFTFYRRGKHRVGRRIPTRVPRYTECQIHLYLERFHVSRLIRLQNRSHLVEYVYSTVCLPDAIVNCPFVNPTHVLSIEPRYFIIYILSNSIIPLLIDHLYSCIIVIVSCLICS